MPEPSPAIAEKPRAPLLRAAVARLHLGVLAISALSFAAPIASVSHGTEQARACVASFEAPRGPELPDCRHEVRWFVTPSRVPWTATTARYRAEEINMRQAVAAYKDAAVGRPDAAALGRAADDLIAAEKVIRAGSQRVTLDELGRAVGAPDVGRSAMLLGDRRTLLAKADLLPHWSTRLRALEAALVEGDVPRAEQIAKRYAEFDPRDDDLRVAVASMLCLSGEGKRGLELLNTIQAARAKDRHESWARNWGEVRAAIVACASKAGLPLPPLPERDGAGVADHVDARTALRLRLLSAARSRDPFAAREAANGTADLLDKGPMAKGARVRLLAGVLAIGRTIEPELAATLATPSVDRGEPRLLGHPLDLTAIEQIEAPRGLRVLTPPETLRAAADTLHRMAIDDDTAAALRPLLTEARAAASLAAAQGFALAGDAPSAIAALDDAAPDLGQTAHLARSSAWYLVGDPARALDALDRAAPEGPDLALTIARRLQRAEILASLGRRDDASREALAADALAASQPDRRLDVRAQWTRLALAQSRRTSEPPPTLRAFPWIGPMAGRNAGDPPIAGSWLDPAAESPAAFAAALAFWDAARAASAADRRAMRYAAADPHAGDSPRARVMALTAAARLLAPDEGDVEVWLDAFAATASRGTTLRAYAFARREAARFRGDDKAAAAWSSRLAAITKLAAPAENAELAAVLGL